MIGVLLGVVVLGVLLGVDLETLLDVAEVLFGVDVVLVNDRAAIHTDKLMNILGGKALNTASMAIFSTAVKSALTVDPCVRPLRGDAKFPMASNWGYRIFLVYYGTGIPNILVYLVRGYQNIGESIFL